MINIISFRVPLTIAIGGLIVRTIGSLMKVLHWPLSHLFIIAGTILIVTGLVWLIFTIWNMKLKK
ncbi:MAG: hypothetical protein ABWZ25_03525 [Chitinophagaceae bacterium]